jgi:hypothetical protein
MRCNGVAERAGIRFPLRGNGAADELPEPYLLIPGRVLIPGRPDAVAQPRGLGVLRQHLCQYLFLNITAVDHKFRASLQLAEGFGECVVVRGEQFPGHSFLIGDDRAEPQRQYRRFG